MYEKILLAVDLKKPGNAMLLQSQFQSRARRLHPDDTKSSLPDLRFSES